VKRRISCRRFHSFRLQIAWGQNHYVGASKSLQTFKPKLFLAIILVSLKTQDLRIRSYLHVPFCATPPILKIVFLPFLFHIFERKQRSCDFFNIRCIIIYQLKRFYVSHNFIIIQSGISRLCFSKVPLWVIYWY